jgi:TIR domain
MHPNEEHHVVKARNKKVFLSYNDEDAASKLIEALDIVFQDGDFFFAQRIPKGKDWREEIDHGLKTTRCLILLYTDPGLDWSWCLFEAGAFRVVGEPQRELFCLYSPDEEPPSPLANLQGIKATDDDLKQWIRDDLCPIAGCEKPSDASVSESISKIKKLFKVKSPLPVLRESGLKPFVWIRPAWPYKGKANWNKAEALGNIDFSRARVSIDKESAGQLGFAESRDLELLHFLRELAADAQWGENRLEFWIAKFFESLQEAAKGHLQFQEAAYFRHESGKIFRPIVVAFAKNASGTELKLRVIFASAFVAPLTDHPGNVQRLSDGIRLAIRTRLEVLDPFQGRMSQVHRDKVLSPKERDALARSNPVGGRVIEALDAIWQEAVAHGIRPEDPPPRLFEGPTQKQFEQIRGQALVTWAELKRTAEEEDQTGTGQYPESERLLAEMGKDLQAYLDFSLPRLRELLVKPSVSVRPKRSPRRP